MLDPVIERFIKTIRNYVEQSRKVVQCRQKHFHFACQSCKEFNNGMCQSYKDYVAAWIELQDLVPEKE